MYPTVASTSPETVSADSVTADTVTAAQELERYALRLLQLQRWPEARSALHQLAVTTPHDARIRARLAYARGHEAAAAGDTARARQEWSRALLLDPSLGDARLALDRARPRFRWPWARR